MIKGRGYEEFREIVKTVDSEKARVKIEGDDWVYSILNKGRRLGYRIFDYEPETLIMFRRWEIEV